MATSSFYNDNLYRSYPFVAEDSLNIPHEWLAGIKVRMNYGAGFTAFPSVFLTEWHTEEDQHVLTFSCEAEGRIVSKTISIPLGLTPFARVVSDVNQRIQVTLIVGNLPTKKISKTGMRLRIEPTSTVSNSVNLLFFNGLRYHFCLFLQCSMASCVRMSHREQR